MKGKLTVLILAVIALALYGTVPVHAAPITYTVLSTGSGTLGSNSFSDAQVRVSFAGDTSNVTGSGFYTNNVGTGTVSIAGLGTATFLDSIYAFDNQGAIAAGIGDSTAQGSILDTYHSAFGSYDLTTAIGPLSGGSFYRNYLGYSTNLGVLSFSAMSSSSTFTAGAVPLPGAMWLFGPGLVGLAAVRRQFKK